MTLLNFTFKQYNIEIRTGNNWFFKPIKGHELIANYIEYYICFLKLEFISRVVGIERDNIEKLIIKQD